MPPVEVTGVAVVEGLHRCWKHAIRDLDNEVIVRPHETEAHATPFVACSHPRKSSEKLDSVDIVSEVGRCCPNAVRIDMKHAG